MSAPLPFEPEPVASLAARYPLAIEALWDARAIAGDPTLPRPGLIRTHVFDFEDGLRIIVSRDQYGRPAESIIHVSASLEDRGDEYGLPYRLKKIARKLGVELAVETMKAEAEFRFREISGESRPLVFTGISPGKGIPHWYVRLEPQEQT